MRSLGLISTVLAAVVAAAPSAAAVEPIGAAAEVVDTLTGPAGKLETGGSVYFNDVLKTDATGVGQIIFKDDTKLAIGPNAEVKIDKFVYNDDGSFKELAVGMTKGAFRWISGKSKPEAYKLSTGWANLAIRGTAFDLNVDPEAGTLQLVLYEGEVTVCLATTGECRTIEGRCQYLTSDTRINVGDPSRLRRKKALQLKKAGVIPFFDNERLIRPFHLQNASCKVRKAQKKKQTRKAGRSTSTKTAALTTRPTISIGRGLGRVTSGRSIAPDPDPAPSPVPGPVDSPAPTVEGPKVDKPGKKGHYGKGHYGKGKHGKGKVGKGVAGKGYGGRSGKGGKGGDKGGNKD